MDIRELLDFSEIRNQKTYPPQTAPRLLVAVRRLPELPLDLPLAIVKMSKMLEAYAIPVDSPKFAVDGDDMQILKLKLAAGEVPHYTHTGPPSTSGVHSPAAASVSPHHAHVHIAPVLPSQRNPRSICATP